MDANNVTFKVQRIHPGFLASCTSSPMEVAAWPHHAEPFVMVQLRERFLRLFHLRLDRCNINMDILNYPTDKTRSQPQQMIVLQSRRYGPFTSNFNPRKRRVDKLMARRRKSEASGCVSRWFEETIFVSRFGIGVWCRGAGGSVWRTPSLLHVWESTKATRAESPPQPFNQYSFKGMGKSYRGDGTDEDRKTGIEDDSLRRRVRSSHHKEREA
ncbi:hypothetical protein BDN72DRAFT_918932 [Pluteus cervinus]|uniref:Uncharacterized protein n=1 Tax=Pluteus cervinus TaxID=181527 RepID=A0ACD3AK60_9AGAR|nr:hypothetical protein BDN72DRAFT_918932 [Pluteus cervinus]